MTKRVVVFAGYNRKSEIEDYVLYYLKGLREIADVLIYVADNKSSARYEQQLAHLTDYQIFEKHGEYDFGSWKRGLRLAREKSLPDNADELVLCNDSCYAPVFPFAEMFAAMGDKNVDFWGVTKNCNGFLEHVQSYFMVFKKNVFSTPLFINFFENVKSEKSFWDVINHYEVGLSRALIEQGKFSFAVYCPIDSGRFNPSTFGCRLLKARSPLLKRKIYTLGGFAEDSGIRLLLMIDNKMVKSFMQADFSAHFLQRIIHSVKRFFYQNKVTKSGHRIIKICKIPVLVISKEYNF